MHPDLEIASARLRDYILWESGMDVASYARSMSDRRQWGGGIEMAVWSRMQGMSIFVYERCPTGFKRISAFPYHGSTQKLHLLYAGGVHYDLLLV